MKSKAFPIAVIVIFALVALVGLWQHTLYQKLSKTDMSCGGDWSFMVSCPFGSACSSLGQGSLAGGICKVWLSSVFGVFGESAQPSPSPSPLPSPQLPQPKGSETEKIVSSEVMVEGCKIKVFTTEKEFLLDTNIGRESPEIKCYQFLLNTVSPSGEFLVFQDRSGGLDAQLRVYTLRNQNNDSHNLDVLGTSSIFYILFLPNDKLAVLSGYRGLYSEQLLSVYNLPGLYKTYPANLGEGVDLFTDLEEHRKRYPLPDIGRDYYSLSISDGKLKIYGTQGIGSEVLQEYGVEDL